MHKPQVEWYLVGIGNVAIASVHCRNPTEEAYDDYDNYDVDE